MKYLEEMGIKVADVSFDVAGSKYIYLYYLIE